MGLGKRISIVGPSGAGKTTLAKTLEARLGLARLELDSLNHQAKWTPLEPELFRQRVREFVANDKWVTDGNYTRVGALELIWARAQVVVWLDLPRWRTVPRVARRSLTRVAKRQELWNGNREELQHLLSTNPESNIILWAWSNHAHVREKYGRRSREPRWAGLVFVRLCSPREVRDWLESLG